MDCATMHDKAGRTHTNSRGVHYRAGNHANNFFFALLIFHLMHVSPQIAATILVLKSLLNKKFFMKNWVDLGHQKNDYKSLKMKNDPGICCSL